jgi:hypothetical protein
MNRAVRNGVCQKAELPHRISHRAACHCRPIQVWESLIYELSDTYLDIDGAC